MHLHLIYERQRKFFVSFMYGGKNLACGRTISVWWWKRCMKIMYPRYFEKKKTHCNFISDLT
eukprot:TRINITY_DN6921_c0_g1_i1.p1 TRINITY_DN6921_c0_g1~~TRINITY_DN6921_c0_g1_i1.p1  ORF type:complete len:62 (-),score=7.50 TRINITY_DN6921_c0_g1_i1:128-313(-)